MSFSPDVPGALFDWQTLYQHCQILVLWALVVPPVASLVREFVDLFFERGGDVKVHSLTNAHCLSICDQAIESKPFTFTWFCRLLVCNQD